MIDNQTNFGYNLINDSAVSQLVEFMEENYEGKVNYRFDKGA